jgi:hypothetical protein
MNLRRLRKQAARKNLIGDFKRRVARAQQVVTDAFIRMFDGESPARALKNALLDHLFDMVMRPVIRRIVADIAPAFSGNAPPMTAH